MATSSPQQPSIVAKSNTSYLALLVALIALAVSTWRSFDRTAIGIGRSQNSILSSDAATVLAPPQSTVQALSEPSPITRIISYDPLIIHIENFLTPEERHYLLAISKPHLRQSTVFEEDGTETLDPSIRTSSTAYLPTTTNDTIITRILHRASAFQGYLLPNDLQITAYQPGQQYHPHVDWLQDPTLRIDRLTTFFAILKSTCTKECGTQFPEIPFNRKNVDEKFCEVLDCGKKVLTSRNLEGSALFWRNLDEEGKGREDVLHAGLPAVGGEKVGLNIWTEVRVPLKKGEKVVVTRV